VIVLHVQLLHSDRSGLIYTPEQQMHLDEMDRHIGLISLILSEVLHNTRVFHTHAFHTEPADRALSLICEVALREELYACHISIVIPPNLPPIALYPMHMFYMISNFISHFRWALQRQGHPLQSAMIRVRAEETELAIVITFMRLCLDQATWEGFRNRYRAEPLYELGGSVEPLTWDEGDGQGIILRLPWAKGAEG
jgi:hypothetical protein